MAFYGNEYVTDVVISEGITKIGDSAFGTEKNDGIKSITLPASLKVIDHMAFALSSITSIILENVESVGSAAFNGCRALTNVVLGGSLTKLGKSVFMYCLNLETVTINSNIVVPFEINTNYSNSGIFESCNKLTAIYVPADLVDAYKADANWSMYADKIQAIA